MCSQHLERRELERSQVVRGAPAPVMTTHNTLVVDLWRWERERAKPIETQEIDEGRSKSSCPTTPVPAGSALIF